MVKKQSEVRYVGSDKEHATYDWQARSGVALGDIKKIVEAFVHDGPLAARVNDAITSKFAEKNYFSPDYKNNLGETVVPANE